MLVASELAAPVAVEAEAMVLELRCRVWTSGPEWKTRVKYVRR